MFKNTASRLPKRVAAMSARKANGRALGSMVLG